ncbi:hypothetical protein [Lacihabitans lacunae]|uniref:Uncharacterized protein n=1 Tax=Lacihabitans lacunae TaxID=1028214 RepID=A0ABV7YSW9_9BACT
MNNIDYNYTHSLSNNHNQRKSNKIGNNRQASPFNPIYLSAYFCIFLSLMTTKFEEYSWLSPVLFASLGYHLFLIFKKQNQTGYFPFFISLSGAGIMLLSIFSTNEKSIISFIGISLLIIGVTLNLFGRGHKKSI